VLRDFFDKWALMRSVLAFLLACVLCACEKQEEVIPEPRSAPTPSPVRSLPSTSAVPQADQDFAMKAASSGLAEVEASRAVSEKTTSDGVREFAQRMVQDHGRVNQELIDLATAKQILLPTGAVGPHADALTQLTGAMGADSDRRYVQDFGIQAHKEAIALFERQAREGSDAELKAFAESKLPTLKTHLEHAQKLAEGLPQ
jgi:putative membrane protein